MAARTRLHAWLVGVAVLARGSPCQGPAAPAPAPEFKVTTRTALHDHLTLAALVHEVLVAARHVPGATRTSAALTEIRMRRAIGETTRAEALEQGLLRQLAQPGSYFTIDEQASLIEPIQRAQGVGAALELAAAQLGDGRLSAQLAVLERAQAADPKHPEHSALVLLAPQVKTAQAPTIIARFANLLLAADDRARAAEFTSLAIQRSRIAADVFATADVLAVLMRGRTERRDFQGARELAAQHLRDSPKDGFAPAEVGHQLCLLLEKGIAAGALSQLRDLPDEIVDPGSRARALARLAAAEAAAGDAEAAVAAWQRAEVAARADGTPALGRLAVSLHEAGRAPQATACLAAARAGIEPAKDAGQRAAFECSVGRALAALGQLDAAIAVIDRIPAQPDYLIRSRDDYLRDLALAAWSSRPATQVLALLDRSSSPEARARTIRDFGRQFGPVPRPERERAQLAAGLVERLRVAPPDVVLAGLSAIIEGGLVTPRDPSALHPWSLPPAVPTGWRTPNDVDAAAHAQALARCLEQARLAKAQVRAMRERSLRCYPDGRLVELDGVVEGLPYVFTLLTDGARTILVGGTGQTWNAWNDTTPPDLGSDEALLEYACIYATQIGDQGGRTRVVASSDELVDLVRAGGQLPPLAIEPPRVLERTAASMQVQATFLFAGGLQTARLAISRQGRVTMHDERTLASDLPLDRESFQANRGAFLRISAPLGAALRQLEAEPAAGAFAIGQVYATGFGRGGFLLDPLRAAAWLRRAEANGRTDACREVGLMLQQGQGTPTDPSAAWFWYRAAAEGGDVVAGLALARLLLATRSPALVAEALHWLDRGMRAGNAEATYERAVASHDGTVVTAAATPTGREQFGLAAERGSGPAALRLGLIHADGVQVTRDGSLAARWFARAAELGVANGHYFLGVLRANGVVTTGPSAEQHYQRAVDGNVLAAGVVLALRARQQAAAERRPAAAQALQYATAASTAGHRYGALAAALLHLDAGDVALARVAWQRATTLPVPAPMLRSFVDPCYLVGKPAGGAVDAAKQLDAWRQRVEAELAARLPGK